MTDYNPIVLNYLSKEDLQWSSFYLPQPKPESYFKDKYLEMIAEQTELIKLIQTATDIKAVQQYCFEKGLTTIKTSDQNIIL